MHIILYIFMYIQLCINAIKKGYRKNNLRGLVFFLYPFGFYNGIEFYNANISEKIKKIKCFLLLKLKKYKKFFSILYYIYMEKIFRSGREKKFLKNFKKALTYKKI